MAVLNYVDRQILTILLQSIKRDLHLSDTQLGLLTGPAFAITFALAGLPLAFLAERRSRKFVILLSLGVWSLCTALIGAVQTFAQLLAARMLVAIGEAGSAPASQSVLGDLYPHGRRAGPMAIFSASVSVGILIGLVMGGALEASLGWRNAFIAVGLPGLAVTVVLAFAFREPTPTTADPAQVGGSWKGLAGLWAIRPYRGIVIGGALHLIAASALNQWIAAYLIRAFALGPREVGVPLGLLVGCVGGAATIAGGLLADRLARLRPQWLAWLPALTMVTGVPAMVGVFLAPTFATALALLVVPVVSATAYISPLLAGVQLLAPMGTRTAAAGLMMLVGGVFGQAVGPLLVGFLSDQLVSLGTAASLRVALGAVTPISLIAAAVLWKAGSEIPHAAGAVLHSRGVGAT